MRQLNALFCLTLLLFYSSLGAQDPFQQMDDAFTEMETNQLTLHFSHAITGEPIPGATVQIEDVGTFESNSAGEILFPIPEDNTYTVVFTKEGFITTEFPLEIRAGTLFFNRFSVSPSLPLGNIRVVLDWNKTPADLDAHFIKAGRYHISYHDMRVSEDRTSRLDRDDRDGYGPETVTVTKVDQRGDYEFLVHDYTNRSKNGSPGLARSGATVKVYGGEGLLHMFQVPRSETGTVWRVFRIRDARIDPLDYVDNQLRSSREDR